MEILLASIKHKGRRKLDYITVPDCDRISNDKHTHQMYKDKVCDSVEDCKSEGTQTQGLFMKIVNQVVKATAMKPKYKAKGQFQENHDKLKPEINKRDKLKHLVTHAVPEQLKYMKDQLGAQRKQVKQQVKDAQENWS